MNLEQDHAEDVGLKFISKEANGGLEEVDPIPLVLEVRIEWI